MAFLKLLKTSKKTSIPQRPASSNYVYQNVNGLRTKLQHLRNSLLLPCFDFVVLTETNLITPDILSAEFGNSNFIFFRCDRTTDTSHKKCGGGVLIGVSSKFSTHQISLSSNNMECVFIKVKLQSLTLIIGAVYLPSNYFSQLYSDFCSLCEETVLQNSADQIILIGDFNLPRVDWSAEVIVTTDLLSLPVMNMMNLLHLKQVNNVKNTRGVLLDLVFSNFQIARIL